MDRPDKKIPVYRIDIQFNPGSGMIRCETEIQNPSDSVFYLTRSLTVESIAADGRNVHPASQTDGDSPLNIKYTLTALPDKLKIKYPGQIKLEDS